MVFINVLAFNINWYLFISDQKGQNRARFVTLKLSFYDIGLRLMMEDIKRRVMYEKSLGQLADFMYTWRKLKTIYLLIVVFRNGFRVINRMSWWPFSQCKPTNLLRKVRKKLSINKPN